MINPLSEYADRLSYLVTLLLTLVAFQYSISDSIPNVPYLTLIEAYLYVCVLVIFATGLWTCSLKLVAGSPPDGSVLEVSLPSPSTLSSSRLPTFEQRASDESARSVQESWLRLDAEIMMGEFIVIVLLHLFFVIYGIKARRENVGALAKGTPDPPKHNLKVHKAGRKIRERGESFRSTTDNSSFQEVRSWFWI